MILSIKNRIDDANRTNEESSDGVHAPRANIPESELAELSEVRRSEHIRRAREVHTAKLAGLEARAQAQVEEIPVDGIRPFGLPEGMAPIDIWNMILDHIQDPDDVFRISDTCDLFRDLLKGKYIAIRMVEVARLIPDELNMFTLRQVCKSSKAAVDEFLLNDNLALDYRWLWFSGPGWIEQSSGRQRPLFVNTDTDADTDWFGKFLKVVTDLETQNFPNDSDSFPFREVDYQDFEEDVGDPNLGVVRTRFQRLLQFVGSSIRKFEFCCFEDNSGSYNLLRSFIEFMPNLVELLVEVNGDPRDAGEPQLLLEPFPTCTKLKRFHFTATGIAPAFIAEIIRANPSISEVNHCFYGPSGDWENWKREDFGSIMRLLALAEPEMKLTRYHLSGIWGTPPLDFLQSRFAWPLKHLAFTQDMQDPENRIISSKTLFGFINSFSQTLEDVAVTWKMRDTGGYLDLPKVTKVLWKLGPEFMSMQFIVALGNLQLLHLDLSACDQANGSFENAKTFIEQMNLPPLFPALRKIRGMARMQMQQELNQHGFPVFPVWRTVWKP